ncbi:SMAD/FHA domain-containing protein [Penicillium argentinense]|uniref:SMAD/FHA domain-containing protein n=1 Tax=Penicillium argentinense TaxID=1131581 RepID=A0A9W9FNS8_9EURO|nr:SMAD/FHA domain-containing protein [Penicillium argentinense]KAJ5103671.1 SMAD/FHA domain-containing protein [Penicillium argentinense]
MAGSQDGHDGRRQRSPADSPDRSRERRRQDLRSDYHKSSRRRDDNRRNSHRDSPRRQSSRSPSGNDRSRRDRDSHRRDRRERSTSAADEDRRRHSHRSHRHREDRDGERSSRRHKSPRRRSRSPRRSPSPPKEIQRRGPLPSQSDAFSNELTQTGDGPPPPEREKPNFRNTGRLAAESNRVQVEGRDGGIVLKYHEPPEARKPPSKEPWRMYVFKGEDLLEMVELGGRSCWLVGREQAVVDFPLEHPSCSKQHAALQFRYVEKRNEYGDRIGKIKPYIIDLESANGTSVNGESVPAGRYMEVMDKDVIKFGLSSREYVIMLPS